MSFVSIDPVNMLTKLEVRSFTHFWDNRGSQGSGKSDNNNTNNKKNNVGGAWAPIPGSNKTKLNVRDI